MKCWKCLKDKDKSEFSFVDKKAQKYNTMCKPCKKDYTKGHYQKHKKFYKERNQERRKKALSFVNELKNNPCVDCKKKYPPYVMDFDHIRNKNLNISTLANRQKSIKQIVKEVKKCELVCSNCHRIRTYKRHHNESIR